MSFMVIHYRPAIFADLDHFRPAGAQIVGNVRGEYIPAPVARDHMHTFFAFKYAPHGLSPKF
jgi:hypothetical protein